MQSIPDAVREALYGYLIGKNVDADKLPVLARALQNHSGRGFAACRFHTGNVGTNVGRVDKWFA